MLERKRKKKKEAMLLVTSRGKSPFPIPAVKGKKPAGSTPSWEGKKKEKINRASPEGKEMWSSCRGKKRGKDR